MERVVNSTTFLWRCYVGTVAGFAEGTWIDIHSPVSTWGCNISDHQKTIEIHWAPLAIHVKPLRGSHGSQTGPRPTHTASVRTLKGYHLSGVGGTRPRCRHHIAFWFKWAVSWYPGRDPWETLKGFTWIASGVPWISVVFWWSEMLHPHVETGE